MIDDYLLERLCCPVTKQKLYLDQAKQMLIREDGCVGYRISPLGIPILMLAEQVKITTSTGG